MEQAMESVRKSYADLFARVLEAFKETHKELDHVHAYVTQFWGLGYIFLSRNAWVGKTYKHMPPGFYIENLRLELLCAEDQPAPYASIWVPMKKTGLGPDKARQAIGMAAERLLTNQERQFCLKQQEDDDYTLSYELPESREELIKMLLDGEADRFVGCMVSHLELLARFTPVLDKLLVARKPGRT